MNQKSFATSGFELASKKTRKREFLEQMNQVVPWKELIELIEPYAPKGTTGRPPPDSEPRHPDLLSGKQWPIIIHASGKTE